jgi:ABC-type uncharacterized transport system substrate-binding protein
LGRIERRHFLIASSALLAAPLARAQNRDSDRVRTIGTLELRADRKLPPSEYPGSKARRKLGWIEGKNLVVERRWADKPEQLATLAQELVRKRVELIVTSGAAATLAAARATSTLPVVFMEVAFPVEQGLVDSFARPGRNVTGTANYVVGMGAKRYEFLREMAPAAKRICSLYAAEYFETMGGGEIDHSAASGARHPSLALELKEHRIDNAEAIEAGLAGALSWGAQAIAVGGGAIMGVARQRIAEFALHHRLPTVSSHAAYVEAGMLLSYGPSPADSAARFNRSAEYVDRILRGAHPRDLPVEGPRNYELAINLKTAKALGLQIPQSLLVRADRVFQ